MRGLLAILAALLLAPPASAQILWQTAEVGDTVAQIRAKFPAATPGSSKDNLHDGATCSLRIARIEVVDRPFQVCFYFLREALTQVTLKIAEPERGHTAELTFDALLEALRSKYGAENNLKRDRGVMTHFDADWYRNPININLIMIYVGDSDDAVLNINYQTRVSSDASKL